MSWGRIFDERYAWAWMAVAMAVAAATILWLNRGTTFWVDEIALYMESPTLDLEGVLHPHVGHLVAVIRVVYKAVFELVGASYLPFRLLGVGSVLLTVGLLFAYMKRRIPPYVALAPCLILLFFGSDMVHVLVGNAFGVLLAVSCGLGALLALERRDLKGDLAATVLLCLGAFTYTVALAFLAGALVLVLLDRERWRRLWAVAIPIGLYGAWFLWSTSHFTSGPGSQGDRTDLLLLPAWGVQSLGAVFGALSGFDYPFPGSSASFDAGPALAILAVVGLGLRLRRGAIPPALWAAFAVVIGLWSLGAIGSSGNRPPDLPRYLYSGTVVVLMAAAGCLAGMRWQRSAVAALYAAAVCGLAVNAVLLKDAGAMLRDSYAAQARAAAAALDVAGKRAVTFAPPSIPSEEAVIAGDQSPLQFPFITVYEFGGEPVPGYKAASREYGRLGYSLEEVRASPDEVRAQTDSILVPALGLTLEPVSRGTGTNCRSFAAEADGIAYAELPSGGAVLESDGPAGVEVQRFAENWWISVGALAPGRASLLRVPTDRAPDPWWVSAATPSLRVCELQ